MATEGNGALGSSEEVREGPLMDPAHERSVGSLELNSMTTRAIEGLNSSEEREGQQMVPAHGRNQMHGLYRRNLQLRFHQSMFLDSFFTERNVEGQDGAPIHVKLIETSTCDVVRSGPLSCVKLKVVVVEGDFNNEDADDWTQEDFERRVVKEREGKRPLLIGNLSVSLEGGVGSLGKFSFTDNSSWTRSKKFRLGVKVALDLWGDIRVREAITNPFAVRDLRGKDSAVYLQSNRMATEGNGGLGSSEEVREGQLMGTALERVADGHMEDFMQSLLQLLEPPIRRPVREAFAHLMNSGPAMVGGREQIRELDRRNLQLHFQSSLPDSLFTGKKVEGRAGALIRVKLIDTSTGHVVASGPLSSLKLAVVPLEGDFENKDDDWTQEIFESHVAKQRTGKPPLLTGDLEVSLKEGDGSLGELKFTDNSISMRSGKFRLGVKVASSLCEGIRVREGKTNAFKVKDRRGEFYKKHDLPTLDDYVWRLKNIGKNGAFHKRLDSNGISKVKDFLWLLGIDAQRLRKILGSSMKGKMWDTLEEHAKTCVLSGKYHVYYADDMKNSGVAFKNMSEFCGLIEGGKYYSAETLSDSQKVFADALKKVAGDNWKDFVEYEGLLPLEMNPSKKASSSQTDVVAPESYHSDIDQRVSPAFLTHVAPQPGLVNPGLAVGDDFFNHTVAGGWHGFLGSKDVRMECGSPRSVLSQNYEFGSRTTFSSIGDMVSVHSDSEFPDYEDWQNYFLD